MPNASSGQSIILGGTTIRHAYCEKVDIKTIGNATSMTTMFSNCSSLQSVPLFNTTNVRICHICLTAAIHFNQCRYLIRVM